MDRVLSFISKNKQIVSITISVCAGIGIGFILRNYTTLPWSERNIMYLKFPGELFLQLVNCLILPLVTSSIVSATCNLSKSGSIGLMALYYYLTTTTLGIILCVTLVETIRPGEWLRNENTKLEKIQPNFVTMDTFLDLLRNLIPDNIVKACLTQYQTVLEKPTIVTKVPQDEWIIKEQDIPGTNILGLVFFSLLLGLSLGQQKNKNASLRNIFHCLSEVMMIIMNWVTMAAPLCVLFLIPARILEVEEFDVILKRLAAYVMTVFIGLLLQGLVVLPLLYFIVTRRSPYKIIFKMGPAVATACGTSSSTATVPTTIKCLESIAVDSRITRFVVPIGAIINMDGIALYETIGAIFIIQMRGFEFSLIRIIVISITCTVSCIGASGLPSGGYMMLIMVLNSVGVPVEDVSLIIAIDCFVDRFRTNINIIGDALGSAVISHFHKKSRTKLMTEEVVQPLMRDSCETKLCTAE